MTNEEAKLFLDNLKICIDEHPIVADWLVEIADRKTENSSEKPNNCEDCSHYKLTCELFSEICKYESKTEPTSSKMEQVEDEPLKTTDYCDICKRDMCEDCVADATNPYCVPSHYEINYEPKDEPLNQVKPTLAKNEPSLVKDLVKTEPQTSKIIEAYSRGFEDGAEAVKAMPQTERSE